jgi:hypothetical protein
MGGGGEPLGDAAARDILISRTRARNALYSTLPDFPGEQIVWAERFLIKSRLDVATLLVVPRYGPSFISLWADAKKQGLSDEDAADYIWRWRNEMPPKAGIGQVRLNLYTPWDADVDGCHWDQGGRIPKVTEKKVAVAIRTVPNVDAATLLSRYRKWGV